MIEYGQNIFKKIKSSLNNNHFKILDYFSKQIISNNMNDSNV